MNLRRNMNKTSIHSSRMRATGWPYQGVCRLRGVCLSMNRMTDTCKNITFSQLLLRAVTNTRTTINSVARLNSKMMYVTFRRSRLRSQYGKHLYSTKGLFIKAIVWKKLGSIFCNYNCDFLQLALPSGTIFPSTLYHSHNNVNVNR